ncbi:GNAT family N-acetyltransferase [Fulvivirga kasyanovii]|uniref:GNAT family N-acetyltransferase n=1 Tax=Fulvivirga kasyanovii TaxID=396812 RepID=A0ABW9RTP7_9BACT|nr:GNAT family N-acetyltransferase [Fulvivirga kasyanovii]MTI27190.1 GNAT family N-acetyltransferase [Fulvivirga kasyanovii]
MDKKLTYRLATSDDLVDIVRMLADDELGSKRERFEEPLPQSYIKAFVDIARDPHQELTVVEEEGEIIGVFQLTFIQYLTYQGGIRAQIEGVRVEASHRGKGYGKKIFEYAIDRARHRGAHLLQLTTDKQRPEAIEFYEALGFVASHEGMKMHF